MPNLTKFRGNEQSLTLQRTMSTGRRCHTSAATILVRVVPLIEIKGGHIPEILRPTLGDCSPTLKQLVGGQTKSI